MQSEYQKWEDESIKRRTITVSPYQNALAEASRSSGLTQDDEDMLKELEQSDSHFIDSLVDDLWSSKP